MVGAVQATVVSDGQALFEPHPLYAVNATQQAVQATLAAHFLPTNQYRLQANVLHLAIAGRSVLIDSGAGKTLGPALGHLGNHLALAGIDPAAVTDVLLTHCHLDHIGGLMTNGAPTFPKATIHIAEAEWAYWSASQIDLSTMPLEEAFRNNFINTARNNLHPLANQVKTFRYGAEVVAGIEAIDARGHSPGHTNYMIHSGAASLLHVGDAFHHADLFITPPTVERNFNVGLSGG